MFEGEAAGRAMAEEYEDLERQLADPALHEDANAARKLGRRYAQLGPVVQTYRALVTVTGDIEAARELADEDESFAAEVTSLDAQRVELEEKLRHLLLPRDPSDDKDVILQVKAGEGGDESALFAGDLLRMYLRHAERRG